MKRRGGLKKHIIEAFIAIVPIVLIAGGTFLALFVPMSWYIDRDVSLSGVRLIIGGLVAIWLGGRLDKLAIRHYQKSKKTRSVRQKQYQ